MTWDELARILDTCLTLEATLKEVPDGAEDSDDRSDEQDAQPA